MGIFSRFLELSNLPDFHQKISKIYSIITMSQTFAMAIIDTFLILFLLDILSFSQLGIALGIRFAITAVLDFPTGALGDYIGQSRVLRIAYAFLCMGAFLLMLARTFWWVVFAFLFTAIGQSQLSGALNSWFDNQYSHEEVDVDKKIFGSFKGRLRGVNMLINASAFIMGGIISNIFGRRFLILIHLIFILITLLLIIRFIPKTNTLNKEILHQFRNETINKMKQSLGWFINDRQIFFLFLGLGLVYGVGGAVWYNQILFPYYYAYSGNDFYTGIIRSANFLIGLLWVLLIPYISNRVTDERKPFILSQSYADPIFFVLCWLYYIIFPPQFDFVLFTFLGVILLFQIVSIGDVLSEVFFSRILIKTVPEEIRNSIYSLFSTIITLFSIPLAPIGGYVIDNYGFANGILFTIVISFIGVIIITVGLLGFPYNQNTLNNGTE